MVVIIFSDEKNQSIVIILVREKNILWEVFLPLNNSDSNLVDPASSHTLVSKIKPCMCKYK